MGDSLQEQLLKAGLVSEEKFRKAQADAGHARPRGRKREPRRRTEQKSPAAAAPAPRPKREHPGEAQPVAERESKRRRKARRAELQKFLETHKLNDPRADIKHHFVAGKRVKQIYVTEEQQKQLATGELLVARVEGVSYLLPHALEERVRALEPQAQIVHSKPAQTAVVDDAYATFEIPDDLMW